MYILHSVWEFDYQAKILRMKLFDDHAKNEFVISFCNVLEYKAITCDIWGPSPYIFDWSFVNDGDCYLLKELVDIYSKHELCLTGGSFPDLKEIALQFTSGDSMRIVCDSVVLSV